MTRGRPTLYTEKIAARICAQLAECKGLRTICAEDGMPAPSTVIGWVLENREGFSERYASAKRIAYDLMANDIIEIADESINDTITTCDGREAFNKEFAYRSRLRVDARKWLLAKLMPERYGEKQDLNIGGQKENPVEVIHKWED